eukprot:307685-Pelagomonas_calceolata.AAC.1
MLLITLSTDSFDGMHLRLSYHVSSIMWHEGRADSQPSYAEDGVLGVSQGHVLRQFRPCWPFP